MLGAFDEVLKLRGKARKPAIEQWLLDNEDHRFVALYRLLIEKSASRRKLGQEYMSALVPTERETKAYAEMMRRFIRGGKPTLHVAAFEMLRDKPEQAALFFKDIANYVSKTRDEEAALIALDVASQVLDSDHSPSPEKAAAQLDDALDHWSPQIAERAAELVLLQGVSPRASKWAGCPLSGELRRQLARLYATLAGTTDLTASRSISRWENYTHLDTSAVQQVPWPIAYIDRHVRFPNELVTFDPDESGSFGGGSSMYFAIHEGARDYFLLDILYHDIYQYYITLDLTDTSDDPVVYGYDHEGWMRGSEGRLSRFLGRLTAR